MSNRSFNHKELIDKLKNEKEAEAYFYEVIEKCKIEEKEIAQKHLIEALKNLTEAHGGYAHFAERLGLGTVSFYKTLSSVMLKFIR